MELGDGDAGVRRHRRSDVGDLEREGFQAGAGDVPARGCARQAQERPARLGIPLRSAQARAGGHPGALRHGSAVLDEAIGIIGHCGDLGGAGDNAAAGVHIDLDADAIQPDPLLHAAAAVLDCDPWQWVLAGGEDHTLIGTTAKQAPSGFREIGTVSRGSGVTVGGKRPRYAEGWAGF